MWPRPCVNCTGCRYTSASNTNCAPWCIRFITECARCTSPTQFPPSPTTRHDLVCALPSARCIGYRDVVRPWASVYSPSLAHSRGTLSLKPSVTLLTAHVSENFSKHTSLIHYLSFLPYAFCNACLDMYVRQAIELHVLLLLLLLLALDTRGETGKRRLGAGRHALVSGCPQHWLSNHKFKSALTCTIWSQRPPVPDRQREQNGCMIFKVNGNTILG